MKKKLLILLSFILILTALVSCGDEKIHHVVKFDAQNSTDIVYETYEYGSLIEKPEDPVKAGYNFEGWYYNQSIWNFETDKLTTDVTLTAKWERIRYTVTFDLADGSGIIYTQSVGEGDLLPKPQNPTRQNYSFLGWFDGEVKWNFESGIVTKNITLKAKWEEYPTYTVTFNTDGGTSVEPSYVIMNGKLDAPTEPSRPGYRFITWLYNGEPWNFDAAVTADMTLVASWEKIPVYTVKFDTDGAGEIPQQEILSGSKLANVANPEKEDHVFMGWLDKNNNPVDISSYYPTEDTTLKAKWDHISNLTFNVTYDAGNGTESTVIQVAGGSLLELPADPAKNDYSFEGWFNGKDKWNFETDKVKSDITLTAQWIKFSDKKYNVTFDYDDGREPVINSIAGDSKITKPSDPQKSGYVFVGWYNGEEPWNFGENVRSDVTLTAKWAKLHKVTFDSDNSTEPIVVPVQDGFAAVPPSTPTKKDHSFIAWFNGDTEWNFETPVTSDLNLTAKWHEIKTYTVTFDTDGGTEIAEQHIPEGSTVDFSIAVTTKDKYAFLGWYNGETEWTPADTVNEDLTLTAKWRELNVYTVTFITGEDATTIDPIEVIEGQKIPMPDNPICLRGKRFLSKWQIIWYNDDGDKIEEDFNSSTFIVTGDVILEAVWGIKTPIVKPNSSD